MTATYKVEFCYGYYVIANDETEAVENAQNQHDTRVNNATMVTPSELADGTHVGVSDV